MWLKKPAGGTTITWEGRDYHWPGDDPVCEVPQALGQELLGIHGAGYAEIPEPPKLAPKAPAAKTPEPAKP